MDTSEFDQEVAEFELRLERLRALYEQYFLGIERIEPSVARKDVDRRCYQLRRAKLRNTAKRFKVQTLIQRYNTLQQHWGKVCRQIENGQYTRHLVRAERRFGTIAGNRRRSRANGPESPDNTDGPAAPETDLGTMLSADFDAEAELRAALDQAAALAARTAFGTNPSAASKSAPPVARPPSSQVPNGPATVPPQRPGQPPARRPLPPQRPGQSPPLPSPAVAAPDGIGRPPPRRSPPTIALGAAASNQAAAAMDAPPEVAVNRSPPPRRPRPTPNAVAAPSLSDDRLHNLYDSLMSERKKLNQKTALSQADLAKSLRDTEAKLRSKYAGKSVDFKVTIKDGKAVIKPVVR
ncbi:MAG: hypothetical protein RJA70_392 [Pseudomonadota bacterium]